MFFTLLAIACSIILLYLFFITERVPGINIEGANIIVTGASEGLGLQICIDLVKKGANVVLIARKESQLQSSVKLLEELKAFKHQIVKYVIADVTDFPCIRDGIEKAVEVLGGRIEVLINNAGITRPQRFDDLELVWFERVMKVNYFGNVHAIKAVLPFMKQQRRGRIIGISSLVGLASVMGYSCYSPTKSAIRSLYEALHQEYYAYNISFSVAFPASIRTASYYEEQTIKPEEVKLFEKCDPVLSPETVSEPIVRSLKNWRFFISPSGLNSDLVCAACAGLSPASFSEAIVQVFGAGLIRLFGLFLFNDRIRRISLNIRSKRP
ncbi:3-ketodihydrosphingosine reductase-like [Schistocerca gregaria]|uniref:3-ketodihydrosphingosine reductase-like n=1 Tax=Schistocerca gregaria TaxID=7010 RepID=UPI00211EE589|nr:3-ketodihydrosphingosine reductase-like [Schistocerca gregaria]